RVLDSPSRKSCGRVKREGDIDEFKNQVGQIVAARHVYQLVTNRRPQHVRVSFADESLRQNYYAPEDTHGYRHRDFGRAQNPGRPGSDNALTIVQSGLK